MIVIEAGPNGELLFEGSESPKGSAVCFLCGERFEVGDMLAFAYWPEAEIHNFEHDLCLSCAATPSGEALMRRARERIRRLRSSGLPDDALDAEYLSEALAGGVIPFDGTFRV